MNTLKTLYLKELYQHFLYGIPTMIGSFLTIMILFAIKDKNEIKFTYPELHVDKLSSARLSTYGNMTKDQHRLLYEYRQAFISAEMNRINSINNLLEKGILEDNASDMLLTKTEKKLIKKIHR